MKILSHCPHCRSKNISSFKTIYQEGLPQVKDSSLSEHITPPKSSGSIYIFAFLGILISGIAFVAATFLSGIILANSLSRYTDLYSFAIGGIVAILVGIIYFLSFAKRISIEKKIRQAKYEQWQKGWMCLKCSYSWYLN